MTADHTVAEAGYQERDDCAEAVKAARAERDEYREHRDAAWRKITALNGWLREARAERDALRARIEALADECASSACIHLNTLWGRLRAALEATS